MHRIIVLLLLLPLMVFAQLRGPKIKSNADIHDFGEVEQGAAVKYNYMITNDGDDTLKIAGVLTSCGCTVAELSKKFLMPGETIPLHVDFNTKDRVGPQLKYITITSNDKDKPVLKLTIMGKIKESKTVNSNTDGPKIRFTKDQHDFGVVQEGKVVDFTFEYTNSGKKDLEIKDVKTSCGCTAAVVSGKKLKPGEKGTLKVELDTSNRMGRMSRVITVSSNDPDYSQKILTIYAEVVMKEKK
ncbi:MAG: hypothetical protein AMXMBFR48_05330 [Ignavibacteriales bacterium]